MMGKGRLGAWAAIGVMAAWAVAALAGVVCGKCGWENADGTRTCVHCQGALPEPTPPAPVPSTAEAGGASVAGGFIDAAIVEAEVAAGREQLEQGQVEVARFFFRNAAALDVLTDPASAGARPTSIADYIARCDTTGVRIQRMCPACEGTGKKRMAVTSLKGETVYRDVPDMVCPTCNGSGKVAAAGTMDEQKFAIGRASERYATLQRARRSTAAGAAWVPAEIQGKLTVRQIVTLKKATAAPCSTCMGIGRVNCRECNGTAMVKCPNRDCEAGTVKQDGQESSLLGNSLKRLAKCRTCGGAGRVSCADCRGVGSLVCADCNGTGQRPSCRRCAGEGLVACRRCDGTGSVKGVTCAACAGAGVAECTGCGGDGRKR